MTWENVSTNAVHFGSMIRQRRTCRLEMDMELEQRNDLFTGCDDCSFNDSAGLQHQKEFVLQRMLGAD